MESLKKNISDTLARFFSRHKTSSQESGDRSAPQEPQIFDTITLESIVSLRGQNPFPEEEGEIGSMSNTLRERSLHSL